MPVAAPAPADCADQSGERRDAGARFAPFFDFCLSSFRIGEPRPIRSFLFPLSDPNGAQTNALPARHHAAAFPNARVVSELVLSYEKSEFQTKVK